MTPTAHAVPVPGPRGAAATIAALRGLTGDPCPTLDELGERHGPTFAVGAGPLRMVVVGDPQHLAQLFATPSDAFRWGHWANTLGFFVGDGSMIVSDGEDHRRRRGVVQPGFARRRLEAWTPMIVEEVDRTVDEELVPSVGAVDLFPIGRRLVLHVVAAALFGAALRARAADIDALVEPGKTYLEQPGVRQLPHPFPFTRRARARRGRRGLDAILDAEMARRRRDPDRDGDDILGMLLGAHGDDGSPLLTDGEIRDQVVTLLAAGFDTTASTLGWMLLRAGGNPTIWRRLREEAGSAFAGGIDADVLARLPYARAVVRETLRVHPPGVFAPRQAARDVELGPHVVPRGAMILWSPYLAGRDRRAWPEPLRFDPERHLTAASPEQAAAMESAWVPFGRGPRKCIGFALAETELTLAAARLAQRVDLALETTEPPRPYGMVVNRPTGGVRAVVSPAATSEGER